ncbi:MAG: DUF58 domain-containing protein [Ruminococcus sp.]|nr:DUF58 domain-containing protein [Ruminococcus sp.]
MIVLLVILSAAVLYLLAAVIMTLALRCPVRDMQFSGDEIIVSLPRGRLPVRVRMKLKVRDSVSGEEGGLSVRTVAPRGGKVRFSTGAKSGTELDAEIYDIRAGIMGFPVCRRFEKKFTAARRLPPSRTVRLCRRDDDLSAGAPEGVREFAHGDRLRDLHMKLSAKCGKYMVRERGVNSYVYTFAEAERKPAAGGKPEPSADEKKPAASLADDICAALSCLLWLTALRFIFGSLPLYALAFAAAAVLLLLLSRRLKKTAALFSALFFALTAAAGIAGAGRLTSQIGRAANALSLRATARFDRLFPLMQSEKTSVFAVCFLTALVVWLTFSAARSSAAWIRCTAAGAMLLPLLLFCGGGAALPAGIAAVLLAAAPWRSYGFRGALLPLLTAGTACAVFSSAAGTAIADKTTLSAERLTFGGDIVQPCGRISEVPQPDGETPALEVVMDTPHALYLHGFTGCVYSDGSWSAPHSDGLSVTQEELLSLRAGGFTADGQPVMLINSSGADVDTQTVTVRRLGADGRYAYLADGAAADTDYPAGLENPASGSSVTFEAVTDIFSACEQLTEAVGDADSDYLSGAALLDKLYRADYTDIPDSAERVLSARLGGGEVNAAQAASLIRNMLSGCEYDPYAAPQSAEDLLQKTRCGNSCAFASAAVLAFRYLGIPARYAEGYAVTKEAAGAAAGGAVTLSADDFHAWAEYYAEGVGWLPFETVGEYLEKMPSFPAGGELSEDGRGGGSGMTPDDASGSRVYSRLPDQPDDEPDDRTLIIYPIALAVLLAGYAAYFLLRLERDPLYALEKCASALGVTHDASGSYDLTNVKRARTRDSFEKLEKQCVEMLYSPRPPKRCGGAAAYLNCMTERRKS